MSDGGGQTYEVVMVILQQARHNWLNSHSRPGRMKVGPDRPHLVDPPWVLRTHGELVCQSDGVALKVFAAAEGKVKGQSGAAGLPVENPRPAGYLRHKLGVVVLRPLQKVALAPQQELVQGRLWVAVNVKVVFVGPDLQAHQDHPNVESPIQLQAEEGAVRGLWGPRGIENLHQFYPVDVIYGAQNASLGLAPVSFILEGNRNRQFQRAMEVLGRRASVTLTSVLSTTTNSSTNFCTPVLGLGFWRAAKALFIPMHKEHIYEPSIGVSNSS